MWALDLGRLAAALLVFAGHTSLFFEGPLWPSLAPSALSWFFVLSGFVLATVYPSLKLDAASLREFYLRRLVRIYPLYLLACLLGVAVLWFGNPQLTREGLAGLGVQPFTSIDLPEVMGPAFVLRVLAETLLFVTPLDPHSAARYLVNGPLWSIYCEVVFYLLFPLLLAAMRRIPSAAALWALAGVLWLVQFAIILAVTQGQVGGATQWQQVHSSLYTNPFARLPEFMVGIALALARQRSMWQPSRSAIALGVGAALALFVLALALDVRFGLRPLELYWLSVPANGAMIALLALCRPPSGAVRSMSERAGLLSYAVYCLHWPMLELAFMLQARTPLPMGWLVAGVVAAVLVVGWLAIVVYETPVRARLKAWLLPLRTPGTRSPAAQ